MCTDQVPVPEDCWKIGSHPPLLVVWWWQLGQFRLSEDFCFLISEFLKGFMKSQLTSKGPSVPTRDLHSRVLGTVQDPPLEHLESNDFASTQLYSWW